MPASPVPVYQFSDLTFSYGVEPVLRQLSGEIAVGEFVSIVGPNGAGKSTFLKILAGLLKNWTGRVHFDGADLRHVSAAGLAKRVALVPQDTHVVFPFTVRDIVLMGRLPHRRGLLDTPADAGFADQAMEWTETQMLCHKPFQELSGGERQRVILASALAQSPEVLLLDEPTVYLDLRHQLHFYSIVERLNRDNGVTVISVTHDVNLAARYSSRIIAVRSGVVVVDGPPQSVIIPAHLREIFDIDADVVDRPDGRGRVVIPRE